MSTITTADELNRLRPLGAIQDTLNPIYKTVKSLSKELLSEIMFIAFPRGAGEKYVDAHAAIGADCVAVDDGVTAEWAVENLQLMIDTVCEGA